MQLIERAKAANVIRDLDLTKYAHREEASRVIPAEALAEEGKRRMLLGDALKEGLTLPWERFADKVLIAPAKLCLWVGWSHHGKSQMLKQVMVSALKTDRVCIASMEEEIRDIWCDMGRLACASKNPSAKDIDAWTDYGTARLWFYDQQGTVSADKIKAVIRYAAEELKVTQFVVDSLMMLAVSRDDYDAQSRFVGELKTLAHDTRCTIHLVAHMRKRDGKGGDDQPGGSHDIAGGHEIYSKADYVFNVWRDKKLTGQYPCVVTVDKQRGRVNWLGRVGLGFDADSRQYTDGRPVKYCGVEDRPF
jgi:twinkle protein